jgi:hypothetical protein
MAGETKTTELEIIYWSKGANNIKVWSGPVIHGVRMGYVTPDWIVVENGILTLSFSNTPIKVEKDDGVHFDINIVPTPEKRCGNCKHSHESVCENCFGVDGTTEITSNAQGCENWEEEVHP